MRNVSKIKPKPNGWGFEYVEIASPDKSAT
jgi:hypothetical protein